VNQRTERIKHTLKNRVTLIRKRRPVLPPLALAMALASMPALAEGAAQACSPTAAAETEQLPPGFTEKSATVNGVRINYKIGGQGPAVVLLHGYAETSHMWLPLIPQLATSHTVIVPDLRGAGNSERPQSGYDKKTMAKDIHELVQQLGYKEVSIVGHDIGLMVAYTYAAQFPSEVNKVVLMDAFLPGVGDWKSVWLMRDLWHFHFYGETPLALVKGGDVPILSTSGTILPLTEPTRCRRLTASFTPQPTPGMMV
jgi:pimeloyl-ACP methyl ester carboxylesterase